MDILIKTTRISSWKNKDNIKTRLERTKRKFKKAALEWDDLVLQAQLKLFIYVNHSLHGNAKKDKLIDELKFTNSMQWKRIPKSKFFVGISYKQTKFLIHPEFMVANHKITDQFIQNLKNNPNNIHDLTGEMKISL